MTSRTALIAAFLAALLFGASTPFAKMLTGSAAPAMLAGLLYLGSGAGLWTIRLIRDRGFVSPRLPSSEWPWLLGAVASGGVLAPVLLMWGLTQTSAADASLLLNLEAVLTAVLAWVVFRENAALPTALTLATAMLVGFVGYGVSLVLFVLALRGLGASRTGAYFSTAPFIGAALAIAFFHEPMSPAFWIAAGLMAAGVWLHLTERHEHEHTHEPLRHTHPHYPDIHHRHGH